MVMTVKFSSAMVTATPRHSEDDVEGTGGLGGGTCFCDRDADFMMATVVLGLLLMVSEGRNRMRVEGMRSLKSKLG